MTARRSPPCSIMRAPEPSLDAPSRAANTRSGCASISDAVEIDNRQSAIINPSGLRPTRCPAAVARFSTALKSAIINPYGLRSTVVLLRRVDSRLPGVLKSEIGNRQSLWAWCGGGVAAMDCPSILEAAKTWRLILVLFRRDEGQRQGKRERTRESYGSPWTVACLR